MKALVSSPCHILVKQSKIFDLYSLIEEGQVKLCRCLFFLMDMKANQLLCFILTFIYQGPIQWKIIHSHSYSHLPLGDNSGAYMQVPSVKWRNALLGEKYINFIILQNYDVQINVFWVLSHIGNYYI